MGGAPAAAAVHSAAAAAAAPAAAVVGLEDGVAAVHGEFPLDRAREEWIPHSPQTRCQSQTEGGFQLSAQLVPPLLPHYFGRRRPHYFASLAR